MTLWDQLGHPFLRATGQVHRGLARGQVYDTHFLPGDTHAKARAKGL